MHFTLLPLVTGPISFVYSQFMCNLFGSTGLIKHNNHLYPHRYLPSQVPAQGHPHCTHGTCGVLHCLLFCDQTRPNLRISLVGYHCAIEFPCGVLLFYCCKYPTTYGVRVHKYHVRSQNSNPHSDDFAKPRRKKI